MRRGAQTLCAILGALGSIAVFAGLGYIQGRMDGYEAGRNSRLAEPQRKVPPARNPVRRRANSTPRFLGELDLYETTRPSVFDPNDPEMPFDFIEDISLPLHISIYEFARQRPNMDMLILPKGGDKFDVYASPSKGKQNFWVLDKGQVMTAEAYERKR